MGLAACHRRRTHRHLEVRRPDPFSTTELRYLIKLIEWERQRQQLAAEERRAEQRNKIEMQLTLLIAAGE